MIMTLMFAATSQAATGQDLSRYLQYSLAGKIFGYPPNSGLETATFYKTITEDIAGDWFDARNLGPLPFDPDGDVERSEAAAQEHFKCADKKQVLQITSTDDTSFKLAVRSAADRITFTRRYAAILGNLFLLQSDRGNLLEWFFGDSTPTDLGLVESLVAQNNGIAQLYRPSHDVLVEQINQGPITLYIRCAD